MLSAASHDVFAQYEMEDSEMINLILGSIFGGAGVLFPFMPVNRGNGGTDDEV